jgi:phosphoribosylamine--glycine ligase
MQKYVTHAIPSFRVCDSVEDALETARQFKWQVAVKPVGLTDGLGVKVMGDQLKDEKDVETYIRDIHHQEISGNSQVIIEEKMTGEEFTIQCFVYRDRFIPTPAVQDFKKLLNEDKGPNTASMGSYSDATQLLPFMSRKDYSEAVRIIQNTLAAFKQETGTWCNGFLYGQFMLTPQGIKLVEFNFRPGDPEWMNTVSCLQDNIADIVDSLINGGNPKPVFKRYATVCKYITPPAYPYKLDQILDVKIDKEKVEKSGAKLYCSCGETEGSGYDVGSERGFAFLAKGKTIFDAEQKIQQAIQSVAGDFYHRSDIGTPASIRKKMDRVRQEQEAEILFRKADENDFLEVFDFIANCPPLESYAEHVYKILLRYFGNSCFISQWRGRIVGFVLGFISQTHKPATYFLWQIGVAPYMQGVGLGKQLLETVENGVAKLGVQRIELTIDPENISSRLLFEKNGYRNISKKEGATVTVDSLTAVKDYYKPGRHFMLYEKIVKE